MKKLFFCLIALTVIGCTTAKKSTDIQAVRMPVAPYLKMSCPELVSEQQALIKEVESAGHAVDKKYQSEKNTELVTWILFAPAAFWLDGNATEVAKFSAQKGQMEAMNEALKINQCGLK